MKQRAVKMPDELWAAVQGEAAKLGLTAGEFVRLAVEEKLNLPEPKIVSEVHHTTPAQMAHLADLPQRHGLVITGSTAIAPQPPKPRCPMPRCGHSRPCPDHPEFK
jgi:hypothetical protein